MHQRNVNLHFIYLDAPEDTITVCKEQLDATERDRASRFLRKCDGDRWAIARAGLRQVLAHYCGMRPGDIRFHTERDGKPVIEGVPETARIHFNLSHSGPFAAVAVTQLGPVGVDIEYRRPIPDWREVASRFFSTYEYSALLNVAAEQRDDAFLCCWTRKEAVIKATGEGLSAELDSFDVSFFPHMQPCVLRYRSEPGHQNSWKLRHFESDKFVGALALFQDEPFELVFEGYWNLPVRPTTSRGSSFV